MMARQKGIKKICEKGHVFYKSSDCPVCQQCEQAKKPFEGFLARIAAPARRALLNNNIETLSRLSKLTEIELKQMHGMGPKAISILKEELKANNLTLKNN